MSDDVSYVYCRNLPRWGTEPVLKPEERSLRDEKGERKAVGMRMKQEKDLQDFFS